MRKASGSPLLRGEGLGVRSSDDFPIYRGSQVGSAHPTRAKVSRLQGGFGGITF